MSNARLGELERRLAHMIRPGTVVKADYKNARLKVKIGGNETAWLPWMTARAGGDRSWHAPEVGEQVLVMSPCGELANGYVVPSVYQTKHGAPADVETMERTVYEDGTVHEYDRKEHRHLLDVKEKKGNVRVNVGDKTFTEINKDKITLRLSDDCYIEMTGSQILLHCGSSEFKVQSDKTTLATPKFEATKT